MCAAGLSMVVRTTQHSISEFSIVLMGYCALTIALWLNDEREIIRLFYMYIIDVEKIKKELIRSVNFVKGVHVRNADFRNQIIRDGKYSLV